MNNKYFFYITLIVSILVQFITGGIEIAAMFIKVPTAYNLIRQLLLLEVSVQVIEGLFYGWLAFNLNTIKNITPKRYIDWAITTPTMLILLIGYLTYLDKRSTDETDELEFFSLLKDNSSVIIPVLLLNWLMLFFGYLGEMNILTPWVGILMGFIPFLLYYYKIFINYVSGSIQGQYLFWYFFIFWSFYGFVAILPYYIKNAFYNILDLFAKNFFGLFLSYIIFTGNY
jgi:bacteriorhodopsin